MWYREAQVTVVIFLVLIMLFVFVMVFYISGMVQQEQTVRAVVKTQVAPIDVSTMVTYMESCLGKVASKALLLVGRSGGVIYVQDGGAFTNATATVDYRYFGGYRAKYNINLPENIPHPYNLTIPEYPYENETGKVFFPYPDTDDTATTNFTGYFGTSLMPPLYIPGNHSIEEQLENYTTNQFLRNCTKRNWTYFEQQGIHVFNGSPYINFTFNERTVLVELTYPITMTREGIDTVEKMDYFSVDIPVRLKHIYNLTNITIQKDITNISYNITSTPYDQVWIRIVRDIYKQDDLINVTDNQSNLYGRPYEFWFLRRNRPPAIFWIDETTLPDLSTGNPILASFMPDMQDPDEDELFVTAIPELMPADSADINITVNDSSNAVYIDHQEVFFP